MEIVQDTIGPCVSQWHVINKENFALPNEAEFQGIYHLRETKQTYTKLFETTFLRDDYREVWNFA